KRFEVLGMKKLFTGYDYTLIVAPILLSLFGIMMIYSASMVSTTIDGLEDTYYLFKQLSWFVLGLIGFLFCSIFPYRHYQKIGRASCRERVYMLQVAVVSSR